MKKRKWIILMVVVLLIIVVLGSIIAISQARAYTPAIVDENGKVVDGSIAELRAIDVNGKSEWITIRGYDQTKPVILFLAGGPGGTQLAATRIELAELEKYFVVVNWDQPGSGKSFHAMNYKDITVDTYIEDGIAVTEYLRGRFGQDKIYLIGESWGSALAIMLAKEKPEYYGGVIGTGQTVAFREMEEMDYNKAIEIVESKGDTDKLEKLREQGAPWYYEGNIAMKSNAYLGVLSDEMATNPNISNAGYNTFEEMFGSEYGIRDSFDYLLALLKTFNVVYPQLEEIDLRETHNQLEVPVYFFEGAYDINAPLYIAEDYYEMLECPKKEWVLFEHSGHSPWKNEKSKFVEETIRVFSDGCE